MQNRYIVRLKDDQLYCFYQEKGQGIFYKTYDKNKWSKEKMLIEMGRENFTAALDGQEIYLFCQDKAGNLILSKGRKDSWESRIILENRSGKIYPVLFNPIIVENGLCLIYNVPSSSGEKSQQLVRQHIFDGNWSQAAPIDSFINMDLYQLQYITKDHCVLFYQTGTTDNRLGYREITSRKIGTHHIFHTTPYPIEDASFLATDSAVHVLYIVRGMFGSRLIYKKKDGDQFSDPLILFEGQRIENCLLLIIKNNIYAMFLSGSRLHHCVSENNGNNFFRPVQYKHKICSNPVKAIYRSAVRQYENQFFCREVYVDQNNPWDIQILPELYEDFYAVSSETAENSNFSEPGISQDDYLKLHSQLLLERKQLEEKERQIITLTNLLQEKEAKLNSLLNIGDTAPNGEADEAADSVQK